MWWSSSPHRRAPSSSMAVGGDCSASTTAKATANHVGGVATTASKGRRSKKPVNIARGGPKSTSSRGGTRTTTTSYGGSSSMRPDACATGSGPRLLARHEHIDHHLSSATNASSSGASAGSNNNSTYFQLADGRCLQQHGTATRMGNVCMTEGLQLPSSSSLTSFPPLSRGSEFSRGVGVAGGNAAISNPQSFPPPPPPTSMCGGVAKRSQEQQKDGPQTQQQQQPPLQTQTQMGFLPQQPQQQQQQVSDSEDYGGGGGSLSGGSGRGAALEAGQHYEWQVQFFKTKMCPYHKEGRCINGAECRFAHTAVELRSLPDLRRTKLCDSYVRKEECQDSLCPFAHSPSELRTSSHTFYKVTLCNFYKKGKCWNGVHCRFAHGVAELRVPIQGKLPEGFLGGVDDVATGAWTMEDESHYRGQALQEGNMMHGCSSNIMHGSSSNIMHGSSSNIMHGSSSNMMQQQRSAAFATTRGDLSAAEFSSDFMAGGGGNGVVHENGHSRIGETLIGSAAPCQFADAPQVDASHCPLSGGLATSTDDTDSNRLLMMLANSFLCPASFNNSWPNATEQQAAVPVADVTLADLSAAVEAIISDAGAAAAAAHHSKSTKESVENNLDIVSRSTPIEVLSAMLRNVAMADNSNNSSAMDSPPGVHVPTDVSGLFGDGSTVSHPEDDIQSEIASLLGDLLPNSFNVNPSGGKMLPDEGGNNNDTMVDVSSLYGLSGNSDMQQCCMYGWPTGPSLPPHPHRTAPPHDGPGDADDCLGLSTCSSTSAHSQSLDEGDHHNGLHHRRSDAARHVIGTSSSFARQQQQHASCEESSDVYGKGGVYTRPSTATTALPSPSSESWRGPFVDGPLSHPSDTQQQQYDNSTFQSSVLPSPHCYNIASTNDAERLGGCFDMSQLPTGSQQQQQQHEPTPQSAGALQRQMAVRLAPSENDQTGCCTGGGGGGLFPWMTWIPCDGGDNMEQQQRRRSGLGDVVVVTRQTDMVTRRDGGGNYKLGSESILDGLSTGQTSVPLLNGSMDASTSCESLLSGDSLGTTYDNNGAARMSSSWGARFVQGDTS